MKTQENANIEEANYELYHNTFTAASQAALDLAKKKGFEVDEDDWFNQVSTGPKKPSKGKTNRYVVKVTKKGKDTKKRLAFQVYGMDSGKYELNAYVESTDLDEAVFYRDIRHAIELLKTTPAAVKFRDLIAKKDQDTKISASDLKKAKEIFANPNDKDKANIKKKRNDRYFPRFGVRALEEESVDLEEASATVQSVLKALRLKGGKDADALIKKMKDLDLESKISKAHADAAKKILKGQITKFVKESDKDLEEAIKWWTVTITKKAGKLFKGQTVDVKAHNSAQAIKKGIKQMKGDPITVPSGSVDAVLGESRDMDFEKTNVLTYDEYDEVKNFRNFNKKDWKRNAIQKKYVRIKPVKEAADLEEAIKVKTHRGMYSIKKGEESLKSWVEKIVIMSDAVKKNQRATITKNIVKAIESGKIKDADLTQGLTALLGVRAPSNMEAPNNVVRSELKDRKLLESIELEEAALPFKELEKAWIRTKDNDNKREKLIKKHNLKPLISNVRQGAIKLGPMNDLKMKDGNYTMAGLDADGELIFISNNPVRIHYPSNTKDRPKGEEMKENSMAHQRLTRVVEVSLGEKPENINEFIAEANIDLTMMPSVIQKAYKQFCKKK